MYPLADFDANTSGFEMGILRETPVPQIKDDIVSSEIVQRGHCGHFRRDVERNAVFDIGDDGVGDGKNLLTEAVITGVILVAAMDQQSVRTQFRPVGRETLTDTNLAIDGHQRSAMPIVHEVEGNPALAAQGWP